MSDRRTNDERFRDRWGFFDTTFPPANKPPEVDEDERSDLYWAVMQRCKELGIGPPHFLALLGQSEDDALTWLREHGHPADERPPFDDDWNDEDDWRMGRW